MSLFKKANLMDPTFTYSADVDQYDEAIVRIDEIHHKTHDGLMFSVNNVALNIQTATPKRYLVIVPSNANTYHFTFDIEGDAEYLVEFFETPTKSANGTALNIYNNNRNSVNTLDATFFQDPTVSVDGTELQSFY